MSIKLQAECTACPVVFTAKHREQVREMMDDHVRMHFEALDEVKTLRNRVASIQATAQGHIDKCNYYAVHEEHCDVCGWCVDVLLELKGAS